MSLHLRVLIALGLTTAIFAASAMSAPPTRAVQPNLRVMTFNVRYPSPQGGVQAWPERRGVMVKVIRDEHPDILGTQELFTLQGDYLADHLKHYKWFGLGRNGNNKDVNDNERMGVFYNTERLRVINRGNFWLSETPNVPGSISWNQPMPRMVTWAEFQDKATGQRFYYFNTHLPYRTKDEDLRERDAHIIVRHIARMHGWLPVIVTGDFNSTPDKPTHAVMTKVLKDAWLSAPVHHGPAHTFHNFTGHPTERIDYIYYRDLKVKDVRTVTTHRGKIYPSDHFPVVADFAWPPSH